MNPLAFGMTLYALVHFDGVPVSCVVDTGAEVTIMREAAAARLGTLGPVSFRSGIVVANGDVVEAVARPIKNVGTSDIGWGEVHILVVPDAHLSEPCILGTDLLARQPITIDWSSGIRAAR